MYHDYTTGCTVTGVLHMFNSTSIDWMSKHQVTVETTTYGSEFLAAHTAMEHILDPRFTLRMLGVPLDGPAWLFGDNQSVVTSSTLPQSALNKRHNALSYHRVREAVAHGVMYFVHMDGKDNLADVLTKFLPWTTAWGHLKFSVILERRYLILWWRKGEDGWSYPCLLRRGVITVHF